jgi:hypothetical protein
VISIYESRWNKPDYHAEDKELIARLKSELEPIGDFRFAWANISYYYNFEGSPNKDIIGWTMRIAGKR